MRKFTFLLVSFVIFTNVKAQSWGLTLNNIIPPTLPKLGTLSNDPVKFYTNNIQRMSLGTNGVLTINGLGGTRSRFLQANSNGDIVEWIGQQGGNSILFSDGSWRPSLLVVDDNKMYIPSGSRFGIGIAQPESELHVFGNGEISSSLGVGSHLNIGQPGEHAALHYIPETNTTPGMLSFKIVSNKDISGGVNNNHGDDPLPDYTCLSGNLSVTDPGYLFKNFICVTKESPGIPPLLPTVIGNINLGHDGANGFIETQGTNPSSPTAGDLVINGRCNRNVYFFSDGSAAFASTTDHVMSISGRLNVKTDVQIGGGTSTNNFLYSSSQAKLYVLANSASMGIKVKGGNPSVQAIVLSDHEKGFAVHRSTTGEPERFSVRGDGKTEITTTNTEAFVVTNAITNATNFKIFADGKTHIYSTAGIGIIPSINTVLDIFAPNGSTATDLLKVGSLGCPGALNINTNGIATFNAAVGNSGSVFKVKNNGNDLFAVRYDGVAYARELVVTLANFPDYVFAETYQLLSISELKSFTKRNRRLPNMPSAKEIEKDGATIGEIQRLTVEKVEELYLYIFQLEEKIDKLNKQISLSAK